MGASSVAISPSAWELPRSRSRCCPPPTDRVHPLDRPCPPSRQTVSPSTVSNLLQPRSENVSNRVQSCPPSKSCPIAPRSFGLETVEASQLRIETVEPRGVEPSEPRSDTGRCAPGGRQILAARWPPARYSTASSPQLLRNQELRPGAEFPDCLCGGRCSRSCLSLGSPGVFLYVSLVLVHSCSLIN